VFPKRALQGAVLVQVPPMVSTVVLVAATMKSGSVALDPAPLPPLLPPLPPLPPLSRVHVLVEVHPYKLVPAAALNRKNICPVVQVAGNAVPVFMGLVDTAPEKSTSLL
jgi:hypothetical protein